MICTYCGTDLHHTQVIDNSIHCFNCFESITFKEEHNHSADTRSLDGDSELVDNIVDNILGLVIKDINRNRDIELTLEPTIVIGRECVGGKGFPAQVSRKHCQISYANGMFKLRDLKSANGTFIGRNKLDCSNKDGRVIKNGDTFYLGQEPMSFTIRYGSEQLEAPQTEVGAVAATRFDCCEPNCGYSSLKTFSICPNCFAANEFR